MNCAGCNQELSNETTAAYAIMNKFDLQQSNLTPEIEGPGVFSAVPVCNECFTDPSHRTTQLKAHFALPQDIRWMLFMAGSDQIGN